MSGASSSFVRLLGRLTDIDVPESRQPLSDRLSQWVGWTDAIALSSALSASPAVSPGARGRDGEGDDECRRLRTALTSGIVNDPLFSTDKPRRSVHTPARMAEAEPPTDYARYRERYLAKQHAMGIAIGKLRGKLRVMLTGTTPAMARLAAVDAVMERVLGAREQSLLAAVPGLLEAHFQRLSKAESAALAQAEAAGEAPAVAAGAWLGVFRRDMQSVLLAELDIRFQPVEGLLEALRVSE